MRVFKVSPAGHSLQDAITPYAKQAKGDASRLRAARFVY
jgi:hypothetical protein